MDKIDSKYTSYLRILHEELIPAMGCTEPIAIAYAGAMARRILGNLPERVEVEASDNIIKNVKSVVVPNTGGLRGIDAAVVAGIVAGDAEKMLEVISSVDAAQIKNIADYLSSKSVVIKELQSDIIFNLIVTVFYGETKVSIQIENYHTNIVRITKNDEPIIIEQHCDDLSKDVMSDRSFMNVLDIIDFAESVEINDIDTLFQRQINYNTAIAAEGIRGNWGANIGSVLLNTWGKSDVKVRAKAMAAAGSDARMSGCELPVVIVSGSGNQGLTASVPVIEYAKELKASQEDLYRALVVSNLITIHLKTGIGRLSAYCGAVSAGVSAGAGIAWLYGGRFDDIAHTIVNALAIASGIVCDGAKPSCAGKIALAVDAGILGYFMYKNGQQFYGGDGIVKKGVENTIQSISRLGSSGMRETDKEIIRIMLGK